MVRLRIDRPLCPGSITITGWSAVLWGSVLSGRGFGAAGAEPEGVGDAADTSAYVDAVPADIVLLVGIFGNISETDISKTIATAPQFCAPGATVLWSRGRDGSRDDINDRIRAEFAEVGFSELTYAESDPVSGAALGTVRYDGAPVPLDPGQHLFTFWR